MAGYGDHVERAIELIALLKEKLVARGWRIANDSSLRRAVRRASAGVRRSPLDRRPGRGLGPRLGGGGNVRGARTIRICVTHGETGPGDIDELVNTLCQ